MAANDLETVVRRQGSVGVVQLKGELNGRAEDQLRQAYAQAAEPGAGAVLLNFRDVDYINSTGIALIVGLLGQARAGGLRLLASGLSPHYTEIFTITRLTDFIPLYPDEAAALAAQA